MTEDFPGMLGIPLTTISPYNVATIDITHTIGYFRVEAIILFGLLKYVTLADIMVGTRSQFLGSQEIPAETFRKKRPFACTSMGLGERFWITFKNRSAKEKSVSGTLFGMVTHHV